MGESDDDVRACIEGSDDGLRGDILSKSWNGSEKRMNQRAKVSLFVSGVNRTM